MTERSIKRPVGILSHNFVEFVQFIFPPYFLIIYLEVDPEIPIILGDPFLETKRPLVDVEGEELKFQVINNEETFDVS